MTIILSTSNKYGFVTVCDRMVSSSNKEISRRFNKTIITYSTGGISTVSFTGVAKIGDSYTDTWIVEKLLGEAPKEDAIKFGNSKKYNSLRTIRSTRNCIYRAIKSLIGSGTPGSDQYLEIAMSGQEVFQGRIIPHGICFLKKQNSKSIEVGGLRPRDYFSSHLHGHFHVSGGYGKKHLEITKKMMLRAKRASQGPLYLNSVRDVLVDALRDFSEAESSIGSEAMEIIGSFDTGNCTVSFSSIDPKHSKMAHPLFDEEQATFSPWILSPRRYYPPHEIAAGSIKFPMGSFTNGRKIFVEILGNYSGSGICMSPLQRKIPKPFAVTRRFTR
ncbi:hypothetical protein [Roseobacter ponti]|uniref:Uncharacterized protein n=1 Tax=Roseobacter ponti TaxID=1891787 RepID=A0A858SS75_9RHOB|nr:hypothetical protein [Roseobacter ponti]QJF50758.1 hypothetical protein G3256_06110 [Roseobacter ponti]